jgi:hypothetical protein
MPKRRPAPVQQADLFGSQRFREYDIAGSVNRLAQNSVIRVGTGLDKINVEDYNLGALAREIANQFGMKRAGPTIWVRRYIQTLGGLSVNADDDNVRRWFSSAPEFEKQPEPNVLLEVMSNREETDQQAHKPDEQAKDSGLFEARHFAAPVRFSDHE